jgi:hypothetical protein
VAERTGLEPATPCVTGRYSNQLNYRSTEFFYNRRSLAPVLLNLMPGSSLVPHGAGHTATGYHPVLSNLMPGSSLVPHGAGHTATGYHPVLLNLMPGSSLLSHGETPHYHRRYGVSLLSSAWGQVGPPRSRRQANSLCSVLCLLRCCCVGRARKVSHIPLYAPSFSSLAALLQRKILRTSSHHRTKLKIISHHQNIFGVVRLSLTGH